MLRGLGERERERGRDERETGRPGRKGTGGEGFSHCRALANGRARARAGRQWPIFLTDRGQDLISTAGRHACMCVALSPVPKMFSSLLLSQNENENERGRQKAEARKAER